ncbi:RNA-binding protein 42 [Chanodichthys erythropterus]|uniref:RNA-binding protein 42 n=1 Tax=Chanodichthys erythropterus TaxID=933992 RepID=UPI00351F30EE
MALKSGEERLKEMEAEMALFEQEVLGGPVAPTVVEAVPVALAMPAVPIVRPIIGTNTYRECAPSTWMMRRQSHYNGAGPAEFGGKSCHFSWSATYICWSCYAGSSASSNDASSICPTRLTETSGSENASNAWSTSSGHDSTSSSQTSTSSTHDDGSTYARTSSAPNGSSRTTHGAHATSWRHELYVSGTTAAYGSRPCEDHSQCYTGGPHCLHSTPCS